MPNQDRTPPNRILVKLRPSDALGAAESRAGLRSLHEPPSSPTGAFGLRAQPRWYLADLPDGADTPWDLAHARVADQLGVAESDVLFAEPDLVHDLVPYAEEAPRGAVAAADCQAKPQDGGHNQAVGPHVGWHLDDPYSQLASARALVEFTDPRTRIAHLDTGYDPGHSAAPRRILRDLERNFVDGDGNPTSAEDPDNKHLIPDQSGHGTGTLSILAGGNVAGLGGIDMGGAPEADILPLRVSDRVVLLHTSSWARALHYAVDQGCDVVSSSMGGLPSRAWREEVDRAYLAGVCMVTASGDNFGGSPTRKTVYPARYGRVISACGIMADGGPYAILDGIALEGNFGPKKAMEHSMAGFAPNIPWAVFHCPDVVRWNGGGTSAATPQIAAAAALWLEKYKAALPRDWRRVEAVRKALFSSTRPDTKAVPEYFGRGALQARTALDVAPDLTLPQTKSDKDSFAFLRVITGLGLTETPPREEMFNLELAARWLLTPALQKIVPDPDDTDSLSPKALKTFMEAVIDDGRSSRALRTHVADRYTALTGATIAVPMTVGGRNVQPAPADTQPAPRAPAFRRLRVYAVDPSFSTKLETASVNEATLLVPWETLEPGPVGEYLAVRDVPIGGKVNAVDLDDRRLLAQDGWAPAEGNLQFHQQMAYAVAMKTIGHFERALGRPVLWRHGQNPEKPDDDFDDSVFVRRLEVRPHALRTANAFYSPDEIALQFGYFESSPADPGDQMPGSRVYTCLSHDIVAHETTHAILDGMYRRFNEATNPDVLAFHEGFADIVALFQHFTIREILELEIGRTRGDVEAESILGSLAVQFGRAIGGRGALRDAIGTFVEGKWTRIAADPAELGRRLTPHARGAILVAAVFDAFIAIYRTRTQDLLRIYTGGTGTLPAGAIHPDLVRRLADEAATSAHHVLTMCIRALDYLPPVDVTFFEYLRALITADFDLVTDDRYNYRVAFIEAFRRWGIYSQDVGTSRADTVRTLSVDTVRWRGLDLSELPEVAQLKIARQYRAIGRRLKRYANRCLYLMDRRKLFERTREERRKLHDDLEKMFLEVPKFAEQLGLDPKLPDFEVHELRSAMRGTPDGRSVPQVIVALTQVRDLPKDARAGVPAHKFRGGSTLVVDLERPEVKYRITKGMGSKTRRARTAAFLSDASKDRLRALVLGLGDQEPFARLHSLQDV